jgi:AbrB family looped-hinge helix DNA binding protein
VEDRFDIWAGPSQTGSVISELKVDDAGRIVLPKSLRDELRLVSGDTLLMESTGEQITLRPLREKALLTRELGVWVYHGEPTTDVSLEDLIEESRNERCRDVLG